MMIVIGICLLLFMITALIYWLVPITVMYCNSSAAFNAMLAVLIGQDISHAPRMQPMLNKYNI